MTRRASRSGWAAARRLLGKAARGDLKFGDLELGRRLVAVDRCAVSQIDDAVYALMTVIARQGDVISLLSPIS